MTSYPEAPTGYGQNAPAAAPAKRPGTLVAAIGVAVVTSLIAIVDGVLMLTGGKDLALDVAANAVAEITGETADAVKASGGTLLDLTTEEVLSGLNSRGYLAIVVGALLLLFGLLMSKAAVWARVLVTIFAVATAGVGLRIVTDTVSGLVDGLGGVILAAGLVAIVVAWLPANGRYAKARKQAAAAL